MNAGIPLPVGAGDYQPIQFQFQMIEDTDNDGAVTVRK